MSRYEVNDPDHKSPCPYDDTHMIMLSWMPYHLMKCRKNYVGNDFTSCPFNAHHEVPRPELRYHTQNCPDRLIIGTSIVYEHSKKGKEGWSGNLTKPVDAWTPPPSSEDWDDETDDLPMYTFENRGASPARKKPEAGMTAAQKQALIKRNAENLKRKFKGMPPLEDDEPLPDQGVRAPLQGGQAPVFQMAQQQGRPPLRLPSANPVIPQVYARSLAMAGIGRGRGINMQKNSQPPGLSNGHASTGGSNQVASVGRGVTKAETPESIKLQQYLQQLGRGRGLGRGGGMPQPGKEKAEPQPGRTVPVQPPAQPAVPTPLTQSHNSTRQQSEENNNHTHMKTHTGENKATPTPAFIVPKVMQSVGEKAVNAASSAAVKAEWTCNGCTFLNHPALDVCEMCNRPKLQDLAENKPHTVAARGAGDGRSAQAATNDVTKTEEGGRQRAESTCSDSPDETDADPAKETRRLKKKLAQIDNLVRRQREGAVLTGEEREKMSKRKLIVYQLESMSLG